MAVALAADRYFACPHVEITPSGEIATRGEDVVTEAQRRRIALARQARDWERRCRAAAQLASLRLIGIMQYGPATPTPEQDVEAINRYLNSRSFKVLSWDQIKRRKSREVSLDQEEPTQDGHTRTSAIDRFVHQQFLTSAFD